MIRQTLTRARQGAAGPVSHPFPLRVGGIDVGSNAIRMLAAEFSAPGSCTVLTEERVPIRLGHDTFLTGRLAPDVMDTAVAALAGFARSLETLGVGHYRAVATSAVRESRNAEEFLERVREEAGIELEAITGYEEARLVYLAARERVALGRDKWILVDLGGGSVEVSLVDENGILWSESHRMGSVRLLEELSVSGDAPGRFQRLLREYAATLQIPAAAQHWSPAGMIATGGNIEALARLSGDSPKRKKPATLTLEELRAAIETLATLSFRERVEELGLREDRADVILPAAMVYERVAAISGVSEILVPGVGVRDGLVLDMVDELTTHQEWEDRRERRAVEGAVALGRRYLFDEAHAMQVARLATSLFEQLCDVHQLDAGDRRLLLASAILHDVGAYVSAKRHHKHSLYLIAQAELPEFSPREIQVIANVARYHRKSGPQPHHEHFAALPPDDQLRVRRMASLLRVADALDREHLQRVAEVRTTVRPDRVDLDVTGDGDLLLERWAVRRKGDVFEATFARNLRIGED